MTQRQLLIVNVLVSFLPWVFPAGISLVMLLILGLISVYIWYIQRDYDQRTAYMTLAVMTLLTMFHFFLFDQSSRSILQDLSSCAANGFPSWRAIQPFFDWMTLPFFA